jgi:hypothetical protein
MPDDRPPEEKPPVRHTDLTALEGDPSPEAEHAYLQQRSDLEFERTRDKIKIRVNFAGHGLSPINVTVAQTINLAGAGGAGALAHHLDAPTGLAVGIAIGSWIVGTGLIAAAMRLMRIKRGDRK